jgi:N-formylglutamate amidohydrolase
MRSVVRWFSVLAVLAVLVALAPAQDTKPPASELVTVQVGKLPIILSAPHGGTKEIPGVPERKGEGLEKGSKGFFAGRDNGTEELAALLSAAIEKKMGAKPYLVAARFHRKFLDANRPPEIAYESDKAKPTYDVYRGTLAAYCREVKKNYGKGLLLDLHGQGSQPENVIRGTQNGKTVSLLIQRYGEKAHTGPNSFFGLLQTHGCKVNPDNLKDLEVKGLNGGHIVQTYGGESFGIDAMQLEFGGEYRSLDNRKDTADRVAAAIADYAKLYLSRND